MSKDGKQQGKKGHPAGKIASFTAAALWLAGFVLGFLISPNSHHIWLPDFLLLLGFCPLLWVWKPSWPWLAFGALNIAIGMVLFVSRFLPAAELPPQMQPVAHHLCQYHQPVVWVGVGVFSILFGLTRAIKNAFLWLRSRRGI